MLRIISVLLVLVSLCAAGVYFLLENPDRFKPQIERAVKAGTGYDIELEGELSWRYWPPIAINAEQVRLRVAENPPFANLTRVSIDIDLIPLLTQQRIVDVNEIAVSGGTISLQLDQQGTGNWEIDEVTKTIASPDPETDSADIALTSTLQRLVVENLTVTYIDQQSDSDYVVTIESLHTTALTADQPFDLSLTANVLDQAADAEAAINTSGQIQYNTSNDTVRFNSLVSNARIRLGEDTYPEMSLTSAGEWRLAQQAIVLNQNDIRISSANISSSGVINLANSPIRFDGVMTLETADPARLGADFDVDIPVGFLQFTADMAANPAGFQMRTLEGAFDQTQFKGAATVELGPPMMITAELRLDKLDSTTYLSDGNTGVGSGPGTGKSPPSPVIEDAELLPVDSLRETGFNLIIRIDALEYDGESLANTKVELNNNRQVLDVIANANGYDGKIVLTSKTRLAAPVSTDFGMNLDKLDISQLTDVQGMTGLLSANTALTLNGTRQSEITKTLNGKTTFNVRNGTLDVRPIKSVAQTIDTLSGKPSPISEWPDLMPFDKLAGEHVFTAGLESGQVLRAAVENLEITALGGMDLPAETLNFDVTAMFRKTDVGRFKVSEQLAGIRWPLTCAGSFNASPADLCLGKEGAISDLVTNIIKQDLKRRGSEKLDELINNKVPGEYKDLLKNLFK